MISVVRILLSFFSLVVVAGCGSDISIVQDDEQDYPIAVQVVNEPERVESLDVLVAIDTSCSMSTNVTQNGQTNIDNVANSMILLRQDIEQITNDYRFIFTTTDVTSPVAGPVDSQSADFELKIAIDSLAENPAYGGEEGFAATYNYLTYNDRLTRPEAELLIFMFSDEPEQSVITPQEYYDWITGKFPEKDLDVVTISSWKNPSSCGTSDAKYAELAMKFGHSNPIDICDSGWADIAAEESFIVRRIDTIELNNEPVDGTIAVFVEETEWADWEYDSAANSVKLTTVPDFGTHVTVVYRHYPTE